MGKTMKSIIALFCCGAVVVCGLLVMGIYAVRNFWIGDLHEVHYAEASSLPALEVHVSGFVDGTFDLYVRRMGWPVHLVALPYSRSTVLTPPPGFDIPSNARVEMGSDFAGGEPVYRVHWSADGKRVGVSLSGSYVAAIDFEYDTELSLREGASSQSLDFHLHVRELLGERERRQPSQALQTTPMTRSEI
jgi:hypothetical protein